MAHPDKERRDRSIALCGVCAVKEGDASGARRLAQTFQFRSARRRRNACQDRPDLSGRQPAVFTGISGKLFNKLLGGLENGHRRLP